MRFHYIFARLNHFTTISFYYGIPLTFLLGLSFISTTFVVFCYTKQYHYNQSFDYIIFNFLFHFLFISTTLILYILLHFNFNTITVLATISFARFLFISTTVSARPNKFTTFIYFCLFVYSSFALHFLYFATLNNFIAIRVLTATFLILCYWFLLLFYYISLLTTRYNFTTLRILLQAI